MQETQVQSLGWEDPLENATPVLLPGEFHRQYNLAGYSPQGCRELDTTEQLSTHVKSTMSYHKLMASSHLKKKSKFIIYQYGMISKINHDVEKVKSKAVYVFLAYTNKFFPPFLLYKLMEVVDSQMGNLVAESQRWGELICSLVPFEF